MENINELAAALATAQGEIEPAPKDADNPYFKSKYASLPAVREAMREAFAANGLSVVQMPEVVHGPDQVGQLVLKTVLLHSSGQSLDCGTLSADVDLANPQKIGSAITYFRRYALSAISQTVADEDDDAHAASAPSKQSVSKKDQGYITDVLKSIAEAESLEELANIGTIIKDKSPIVQNAVRSAYAAKQRVLKQKEETTE